MAIVRCYFLDGLTTINGHAAPKLPYLSRSVLDVSTTPTSTEPAHPKTSHVYVQVRGNAVFEAIPAGQDRDVSPDSPEIREGSHILVCGPGWVFKFLESEG